MPGAVVYPPVFLRPNFGAMGGPGVAPGLVAGAQLDGVVVVKGSSAWSLPRALGLPARAMAGDTQTRRP